MSASDTSKRLETHTEEMQALSWQLQRSLRIRKALHLPMDGVVRVQYVKPSGVLMSDVPRHNVRVYLDDELVRQMDRHTFDAALTGDA